MPTWTKAIIPARLSVDDIADLVNQHYLNESGFGIQSLAEHTYQIDFNENTDGRRGHLVVITGGPRVQALQHVCDGEKTVLLMVNAGDSVAVMNAVLSSTSGFIQSSDAEVESWQAVEATQPYDKVSFARRTMVKALGLTDKALSGIDLSFLNEAGSYDVESFRSIVADAIADGLLENENARVSLSATETFRTPAQYR